jgi:hypothetical protein
MRRCGIALEPFPHSTKSFWHPSGFVSEDARPLMMLRFPHDDPRCEGLRQGEEAAREGTKEIVFQGAEAIERC